MEQYTQTSFCLAVLLTNKGQWSFLQGFQPCGFSLSRHKHTEGKRQQPHEEEEQEEDGAEADHDGEVGARDVSPAESDWDIP